MASSQFVIFNVENEEFGVGITQVKEIIRPVKVVSMPDTPEYIEGVINLRGEVYPILNLRKKFKFPDRPFDDGTKIIIMNIEDVKVGFIVDKVNEIVWIPDEDIEQTPRLITDINHRYISGVGKVGERMIIILDLNFILAAEEKEQIEIMDAY